MSYRHIAYQHILVYINAHLLYGSAGAIVHILAVKSIHPVAENYR